MKKVTSLIIFALVAFAAVVVSSCSDDDDKYQSTWPVFSDVTFVPTEIHPGDVVNVTAVQKKKGHLLDRTTYSWSVSPASENLGISNNRTLLYDNDKSNPTTSFTAPSEPGEYTLKFTGVYNVSGKSKTSQREGYIPSGSVNYSSSPFNCTVVISKRFRVKNR